MLNPRHIRLTDRGIGRSLGARPIRPPPTATPPTLAVALGSVISRVRRRAGLSQRQLAGQLRLDRSAISRWESGQRFPTTRHLTMLGESIGHPASSMLIEAEEMVRLANDAAGFEDGAGPERPDAHTREDDHAADD